MRYAVKVAYDGSLFHGSQRQGEELSGSVDGSIVKALMDIKQYEKSDQWPLRFASRTDAGVSAIGNVFTLESDMEAEELLRALNSKMEGIWCWGHGSPRESQNIRWANSRWYRYHLSPGLLSPEVLGELKRIMDLFVGEHDFTAFCKLEEERNPVTYIERTDVLDLSGNGQLVAIDIVGSRFLWQQVRRMVGAALDVVQGKIEEGDLRSMLEGKVPKVIPTVMPPTGLILMDVQFKDIDFAVCNEALIKALDMGRRNAWEASIRIILDSALRSLIS